MTRTNNNNTTQTSTRANETIGTHLTRRYARAQADHEEAVKTFAEAFANNPAQTVEWNAAKIVATQTALVWWKNVVEMAAKKSFSEAVAWGRERAQAEINGFFGGNSTSLWHNACRRCEAETYLRLLNDEVAYLEERATCE